MNTNHSHMSTMPHALIRALLIVEGNVVPAVEPKYEDEPIYCTANLLLLLYKFKLGRQLNNDA